MKRFLVVGCSVFIGFVVFVVLLAAGLEDDIGIAGTVAGSTMVALAGWGYAAILRWRKCPHCRAKIRVQSFKCPQCQQELRKWYDD